MSLLFTLAHVLHKVNYVVSSAVTKGKKIMKIHKIQVIMKIMFKSLFAVLVPLLLICGKSSTFGEEAIEKLAKANLAKLTQTVDGIILLEGWKEACENGYDTSVLTAKEKEDFTVQGEKNLAEQIESGTDNEVKIYAEILARHYSLKKDHRKKMYWSLKAAEKGSSFCMRMLGDSYRLGDGVVQDVIEGAKWNYLGAAAGDEWCQSWVKDLSKLLAYKETSHLILEAQKRAKDWSQKHPEVFISCD